MGSAAYAKRAEIEITPNVNIRDAVRGLAFFGLIGSSSHDSSTPGKTKIQNSPKAIKVGSAQAKTKRASPPEMLLKISPMANYAPDGESEFHGPVGGFGRGPGGGGGGGGGGGCPGGRAFTLYRVSSRVLPG